MKTLFCIMLFVSFCFAKDTLVFYGVIKDGQDNVTGMRNPGSITVSPDNKNVYVISSEGDALVIFNRDMSQACLFSAPALKIVKAVWTGLMAQVLLP